MSDPAGIPALVEAIRHMHGCEATWIDSVAVDETFEGDQAWKGEVQVFAVEGHPQAGLCYAWSEASTGKKRRFFAELHLPPVDGPSAAVRVSIAADAQTTRT